MPINEPGPLLPEGYQRALLRLEHAGLIERVRAPRNGVVDNDIQPTDIHTWFGLSYSNYLVLHRTLLQSMPEEWQHRFTAMLRELNTAFAHVEKAPCYEVTAAVECEYSDLSDADMRELGITRSDAPDGDDDEGWEPRYYDKTGEEHEPSERLLVPRPGGDPVPHYDRGRTYIEPRLLDAPAGSVGNTPAPVTAEETPDA